MPAPTGFRLSSFCNLSISRNWTTDDEGGGGGGGPTERSTMILEDTAKCDLTTFRLRVSKREEGAGGGGEGSIGHAAYVSNVSAQRGGYDF